MSTPSNDWVAFVFLSMHLLFAQLATAGPLYAALLEWRAYRTRNEALLDDGWRMARVSLVALVAVAIFGVALGAFRYVTGSNYVAIWNAFHARILWGLVEFTFSTVVLIVFYLTYPRHLGRSRFIVGAHGLLAVVSAMNLMYHLPPLFAAIADVARGPSDRIAADTMRDSLYSMHAVAKTVHFSVAALFFAGIVGALAAGTRGSARLALRMAIVALVLQWPIGFWLLTTLKDSELRRLMGGSPLHIALLVGGLLASVMALFQLLELGADLENPRLRSRVGVTSVCLLLAMIALLL